MNSPSKRYDQQRPKRPSATARTTMLRRCWGPRQCQATCVLRFTDVSTAVRSKSYEDSVQKATVEEQLNSKTNPPAKRAHAVNIVLNVHSQRAQLHLRALDLSWALTESAGK